MAPHIKVEMFRPSEFDDDAASYHSASDNDSESEDDRFYGESATSRRPTNHDREVLRQEDEQEMLLIRSKAGQLGDHKRSLKSRLEDRLSAKISKREIRRQNGKSGRSKRNRKEEDSEVMYEMEEGAKDLSSSSSTVSFDIYQKEWATVDEKQSKKSVRRRFIFVYLVIATVFVLLAFGAYKASTSYRRSHHPTTTTLSNGTHLFAPTTILISFDGFRADFLNRDLTPALNAFIASGVSPRYMLPSFPSVTFPNHFTLVTGLYPESHGIVGNTFWDPVLQEEFYYTDPSRSMQPKWWTAEPLWVTAENQGVRSAIHMWPGSEAHIPNIEPTYLDKFNETEDLSRKVDRVLHWLDLPGDQDEAPPSASRRRPQFIAAYVPNVDAMGHLAGPNSTEIRATIADVDSMLTLLTEGLFARNLTEIVNMVVVSDHGMATTSTSRLIQLDDIIDLSLVDHIDGWPLRGLRLKNPDRDLPVMYERLLAESKKSDGFDVYTLDTMPDRYHFSNNDRIAPLWIVPKTGWGVVEKTSFDVAEAQTIGKVFHPMGMHGYDHEHPLMRAIFVARGPAFPHQPNSRVPVFQNIEVYNIICDSLGLKPHPNNGTLRLPLQTIGLHSDEDAPVLDTPLDPEPAGGEGHSDVRPGHTERPGYDTLAGLEDPATDQPTEHTEDEHSTDDDVTGGTGGTGGTETDPDEEKSTKGWWDFLHDQLEEAKEWAKGILEAIKGNKHGDKGNKDG
jgi:predicted AlkP superfamily pyrophosphatase or phosphodiesterase